MEHLRANPGIRLRQSRAHRTGLEPVPLESVGGCSPLPPVSKRQSLWPEGRVLACSPRRPRRSIRARRTCAGCSRAPASAVWTTGCSRAKPQVSGTASIIDTRCMAILCERQKQNAPGREPEGVRVASGDRGDRSPRAESVCQWNSGPRIGRSLPAHSRASRWNRGDATGLAMT